MLYLTAGGEYLKFQYLQMYGGLIVSLWIQIFRQNPSAPLYLAEETECLQQGKHDFLPLMMFISEQELVMPQLATTARIRRLITNGRCFVGFMCPCTLDDTVKPPL